MSENMKNNDTPHKSGQSGAGTSQLRLKVGDTVRIYQKPITDEELEGLATLVRHFEDVDDPEIGECWSVRFTGEEQLMDRWVSPRHIQGWLSRAEASPLSADHVLKLLRIGLEPERIAAAHTGGEWHMLISGEHHDGETHEIATEVDGCYVTLADIPVESNHGMMRPNSSGDSEEYANYEVSKEESLTNAYVMAAAPKLLEASRAALAILTGMESADILCDIDTSIGARLNAAIAKAEGRAL